MRASVSVRAWACVHMFVVRARVCVCACVGACACVDIPVSPNVPENKDAYKHHEQKLRRGDVPGEQVHLVHVGGLSKEAGE